MRSWVDTDANGNKLTDGRICLLIKSDENPEMPEIRVYGKDKEEVLDKVAKTAETAQGQIFRMRSAAQAPAPKLAGGGPQPSDLAKAVSDLSNPATAPGAVVTLLNAAGVDVKSQARREQLRAVADLAEAWEQAHPDYPKDPRNDQIMMNRASILAGSVLRVKAEHLDAAFEELKAREMLFEPKVQSSTTVQPDGNPDSRTVRSATSYNGRKLRSAEPVAAPQASAKEQRWRGILENGTGKAMDDAIRNEPGFAEWVDKQMARSA